MAVFETASGVPSAVLNSGMAANVLKFILLMFANHSYKFGLSQFLFYSLLYLVHIFQYLHNIVPMLD